MCRVKEGNAVAIDLLNRDSANAGIDGYLNWWKSLFYVPFGSRELAVADLKRYLTDTDIDYRASLVPQTLPGKLDFYYVFSTLGATYAGLLPRIQEERPDIMEKMARLRSGMEEELAKQKKAGSPNR